MCVVHECSTCVQYICTAHMTINNNKSMMNNTSNVSSNKFYEEFKGMLPGVQSSKIYVYNEREM